MEITHEAYWFAIGYHDGRSNNAKPSEVAFTDAGKQAYDDGADYGRKDTARALLRKENSDYYAQRDVPQTHDIVVKVKLRMDEMDGSALQSAEIALDLTHEVMATHGPGTLLDVEVIDFGTVVPQTQE